ncbi:lactonase family protein [Herbiconiux sp. CPCC 205716]|uniref:Lactonase family protein n=1 Tax=Herbiconiux gentiana TaxID=2970912 RepID=A0ABT2GHI6_9MICO|nr:lactonase family protein [Herbiconiux gentiana]MCS5714256.1 lactonase family protein [Herbiconiux gentiana]
MSETPSAAPALWAGSYTAEFGGRGAGLTPLIRDDSGGLAAAGAASAASPSFVVAHPSLAVLYTADESSSTVSAYALSGRSRLTHLGSQPAGPAVCHVAVDPSGSFVAATCWGDGRVLVYPLDASGRLGAPLLAPPATDPHAASRPPIDEHTDAPPRSQAHMTLALDPLPDGSRMLATTDLGYDLVRFWAWTPGPAAGGAALTSLGEVVLPLGSGPRHLVRTPDDRLLVVTEYSAEVAVLEPVPAAVVTAPAPDATAAAPAPDEAPSEPAPDGTAAAPDGVAPGEHPVAAPYRLAAMVPVLADGPAPGDSAAEIALSPDARHVYVGVRGSDLLATLELDGPSLRPIAHVPSGGRTPRHHLVDADRLHIAHQDSDELTTHALSPAGLPAGIVARLPLGSPTVLARPPRS